MSTAVEDAVEDDDSTTPPHPTHQIEGAKPAFDQLFNILLSANNGRRDLGLALQNSQYACDRLEPAKAVVEGYLTRLLAAMSSTQVVEADRMALAAAVLVSAASRQQGADAPSALRGARRRLLRLGVAIADEVPDINAVRGFARI